MAKDFLTALIYKLFQGTFIGITLVLPGMSAGTALIILGFYRAFLKDISELKVKRYFVMAFGMVVGVLISAFFITKMLELYPSILVSFLLGMLIASVKLVLTPDKFIKPNFIYIIFTIIGFIITWNISQPIVAFSGTLPQSPFIFFAGGVLTSATMLLPGVSGSAVLIMINLYDNLLKSVVNMVIWPNLFVFTLGLIAGVLLFSRIITTLYNRFQGYVSYFLAGLLIGSTKALFPEELNIFVIISAICGLTLVILLTGNKPQEN